MDSTCFSSSDPAAEKATLVFDFNADEGNLWSRSSQDGPLPLCSTSSPPPASRCLVCLDHAVSAVCRNLTDGVKVMMEAGADQVKISKSECPKLLSDECPKLLSDDAPQWQLPVAITLIIIIILIFIGVLFYFCWKRCRNPKEQRGKEIQTRKEDESDVMMKETEIH